ncbi:hypothetical protein F5878DRAFT_44143 [Lentinula raphanica]|uniref:Succinate dehydrogenase assembly factor 4, mitochondrial n=1 Tax=Lentinula raphanica TaxID=153919 RepID=A0AA38PE61_9AGAR|nr:hypothetical protein C8R42DRAFT_194796 [Lentinula raphanica]KAJ3764428.1 hypothetical protein EV360DRAFT_65443 [Lentinula raphanica]KAJ3826159.1 hypothetical protein F5880DRAFT_1546889 [Lentinula raphanica]KAJ3840906.1 hypothetical protein F5878DRAFT_44143 [Lentinula raphanica]
MSSTLAVAATRFIFPIRRPVQLRFINANTFSRPSPPQLPRELQLEFEELQKQSEHLPNPALSTATPPPNNTNTDEEHVNPTTGERGGPKTEPVGRWGKENEGDWSFKGRVSDF